MSKKINYLDCPKDEYSTFEVGDRFRALFQGMTLVFRVAKIEIANVLYERSEGNEIVSEPVIITKSGLVWSTHVSGYLLDFYGRGGADYFPCSMGKTWIGSYYRVAKGEKVSDPYALGEE